MDHEVEYNEHLDLRLIGESNTTNPLADIIFVHGIGGDWFKTWYAGPNKTEDYSKYWPTWLSEDIPGARVWSLDYPAPLTRWTSKDEQGMSIPERARSIIDLLLSHHIGVRPLIFVTHSLGGLMVKQVLRTSQEFKDPAWEKIARQTKAVVFIATPHTGSALVNLGKVLKQIRYLGFVLRWSDNTEAMERDCPHLLDLATWYRQNVQALGIDTKAYYEKAPFMGVGLVVSESSADPGVQGCVPVPCDGDHISIVKPPARNGAIFRGVREFLKTKIAVLEESKSQHLATVPRESNDVIQKAGIRFTMIRLFSGNEHQSDQPWDEVRPGVFQRNFAVAADPIFDIMVANNSDATLIILRVGIRIIKRTPAAGGTLGQPEFVPTQSKLSVHCHQEWKRFDLSNDQSWARLPDPLVIKKDDLPFRFSLLLENFCDIDNASSSEVRFCLETDKTKVESESIWLLQ